MADDGIEAALIKEANPFIDDLAEAVVHALRRDKRTNLPYVQTYPELGLANSTTRQTLPAEITWLLLYSAANAAPDLTLDIQGIVIPVTSFPAQIQLPLWGATVTLTNNDSANNVTVVATDRPILPQVAAAGGSSGSPLYTEATGSLAELTAGAPTAVATVSYTDFPTPSVTVSKNYLKVLSRNARYRDWMVTSTLNQGMSLAIFPGDSTIGFPGYTGSGDGESNLYAGPGNGAVYYSGLSRPILSAHVDSFQAQFTVSSTSPTSGSVSIYIVELF